MTRIRPRGRFGACLSRLLAVVGSTVFLVLAAVSVAGPVAAQDPSPAASMAPASMAPASMAPASTAPEGAPIVVTLADFMITPATIDAVGSVVTFDVNNQGPTPHNFTVRDSTGTILGATPNLSTGQGQELMVTFPGPGTYIVFCSLPGHESLGVKGTLVVTEAGPAGSPALAPMASPIASPAG
jgi:plastocyanin